MAYTLKMRLWRGDKSGGELQDFDGEAHVVSRLTEDSFEGVDIALFSAGEDISRKFAPIAARAGAVVIDPDGAYDPRLVNDRLPARSEGDDVGI